MFFKDEEIPKWVVNSSLEKHNSQEYFFTYINGYICGAYKNNGQKPLLMDGTKFHYRDYIVDDLLNELWPNITSGVRKRLYNNIRNLGFNLAYFIIPFFQIEDTNNQIVIMDEIAKQEQVYDTQEQVKEFMLFFKKEQHIRKNFIVKNAKNFLKLIKNDDSWFEHILGIENAVEGVIAMDREFILPNVRPLNKLLSLINYIKSSKNSAYRIWFNNYCDRYDFFDGMNIMDLTIRIPKSDLDLAWWGHHLNICIGDSKYVSMCASGKNFLFLLEKESEPFIMAHYKHGEKVQLMYKGNVKVQGEYLEAIDKFARSVHNEDRGLLEIIPKQHFINKNKEYRERGIVQSQVIKRMKKIQKIIEREDQLDGGLKNIINIVNIGSNYEIEVAN